MTVILAIKTLAWRGAAGATLTFVPRVVVTALAVLGARARDTSIAGVQAAGVDVIQANALQAILAVGQAKIIAATAVK